MIVKLAFYISILCAPLGLITFFITGGVYLPNPFNAWIVGVFVAILGLLVEFKSELSYKKLGLVGVFLNGALIILSMIYVLYYAVPIQD